MSLQEESKRLTEMDATSPATTSSSSSSFPSTSSLSIQGVGSPGYPINDSNPALAFAEYQHRLQLYLYAQHAAALRLRLSQSMGHPGTPPPPPSGPAFPPHPTLEAAAYGPFARFDPRFRFGQEEPKPQHSYIGLIAMAILSNAEKKMVLSDIYQYILDNYPYFRNRGPGWRNSIRHNLSLNDCFIKAGRSANGKGHYWAIHPANVDDFRKGDFRRRKAQRKVRKHMGLSVPDDEDSSSPSPTPGPPSELQALLPRHGLGHGQGMTFPNFSFPFASLRPNGFRPELLAHVNGHHPIEVKTVEDAGSSSSSPTPDRNQSRTPQTVSPPNIQGHRSMEGVPGLHFPFPFHFRPTSFGRGPGVGLGSVLDQMNVVGGQKRLFDVESLLAPDSTTTSTSTVVNSSIQASNDRNTT